MTVDSHAQIIELPGAGTPRLADTAFVAAGAIVVGDVELGPGASLWYNAVLRAEQAPIKVGENSNLQDNVVGHVDEGYPLTIGCNVSVGHGAVVHGATIEDDCLIGMGATVLNGAVVGAGSLVAAGTVVLEGTVIPAGSLVAGVPGKVRRELTVQEQAKIRQNAQIYLGHLAAHSFAEAPSAD